MGSTGPTASPARAASGTAAPGGHCLLVIDMQNAFLHPKGSCVVHLRELPDVEQVIDRTAQLIDAARQAGVPIVYTRNVYRTNGVDMPAHAHALFPEGMVPTEVGTWDGDIHDALTPRPGDVVIDKNRYDAFLYTDLDVVLRSLGATRLTVAGVVTHACVETTVRSADQRDFAVTVASDCTSSFPVEFRDSSLRVMAATFATVCTGEEAAQAFTA